MGGIQYISKLKRFKVELPIDLFSQIVLQEENMLRENQVVTQKLS